MELTKSEPELGAPLVAGFAPLRAEVTYCARYEMAMTIEDALMRRTGLQFFSWEAAVRAAAPTGAILAKELGWTAEQERLAVDQYTNKIWRLMELAGLTANSAALAN
jgi:glycerol-3-phosphate dehydrogenase